ncbi:MAG TPA: hypothetical protein PLV92_23700, partial [Pirellulaceae bacterium]|nr:hypothetical protein [Pirellulaceae bacterium]
MSGLLAREQRAAWEKLAGVAPSADVAADEPSTDQPGDEKPGEEKPAAEKPSDKPSGKPAAGSVAADKPSGRGLGGPSSRGSTGSGQLRFNFRFAPWKDVLEWFAQQADLSLVLESPPPGTFNYADNKIYTPAEAIDLLNGVLLTKGYVLIRRERMLQLLNIEDAEIPDALIEVVSPEELDNRGRYELLRCLFPIRRMTPEDAEKEVNKLIGPQGKVAVLPQAKQLLVRETGSKLRAIRDLISSVENPDFNRNDKLIVINLVNISTDEFMQAARPLLSIPDNLFSSPDGSIRISADPLNSRLLVSGKQEKVERLQEIQRLLDVDSAKAEETAPVEQPQLEIYSTAGADPQAVLAVMQTLMAGQQDVRLAVDPKTFNLVVLARPTQHATIRETLKQMQRDASEIEVFVLRRVDVQVATVAINKLFGGDEKGAANGAPKVESDPTSRQLIVRGTPAQIA